MADGPRLKTTPRIRKIQIIAIVLLLAAGTVNYLDRGSLAIANTTVRGDLGLSATRMGFLLSVFSIAYAFAQLPAGVVLDRIGARVLLGAGMLLWSLVQAATGLVSGFKSFVLARAGLALGEAPWVISTVKTTGEWFAPADRGAPLGIMNAGTPLAQAIAPPILTVLMLNFGWRGMFVAIGIPGTLLAIAWYAIYRDRKDVRLEPDDAAYLEEPHSGSGSASERPAATFAETLGTWKRLFRQRTIWGMMIGFGGVNYTAWLYISWIPGYLEQARHVSIASTGLLTSIPFLFGAVGMVLSGWIADRLVGRGMRSAAAYKTLIVIGMSASALCTFSLIYAATTAIAVAAISLAIFFIYFAGIAGWGLVHSLAPAPLVGTVASIQNFGSFICASFAPTVVGFLLDRTHSFHLGLMICALFTLLGALVYLLVVKDPIPLETGNTVAVGH